MPEITSIELAKTQREQNRDCELIFVTTSRDYLYLAYLHKASNNAIIFMGIFRTGRFL